MPDIFCKILRGEVPGDVVFRDEDVAVIRDIAPHAPAHFLVVPIAHMEGIGDAAPSGLLGKLLQIAHRVAGEQGLKDGYRLIINEGVDGGKMVPHLHVHLLGGKKLGSKLVAD